MVLIKWLTEADGQCAVLIRPGKGIAMCRMDIRDGLNRHMHVASQASFRGVVHVGRVILLHEGMPLQSR